LHALHTPGVKTSSTETLYVAVLHVLTTDGIYKEFYLLSTQNGVGRTECELRKDAWWAKHGQAAEAAKAQLAEQERYGEVTMTCDLRAEVGAIKGALKGALKGNMIVPGEAHAISVTLSAFV
jgi:hypothetical protein